MSAEAQKRMHDSKRRYLRSVKTERGCIECGIKDWRVLDFDHIDPDNYKTRNSPNAGRGGTNWLKMSWDDIHAELEHCDVICANHHRLRTAERAGWTEDI